MASRPELLEVPARPEAVGDARRWLRRRLSEWSREGIEAAQLVVSELVTNVVLHGRGPVTLALAFRPTGVVLEVADRSLAAPALNRYGATASTGRGLLLVDGIASGWGVRSFPNGKAVWVVLADQPIAPARLDGSTQDGAPGSERAAEPPDWEPPGDLLVEPPAAGRGVAGHGIVTVRILALPIAVYHAAQQHNDALVREFHWLTERGPHAGVPERLVALAAELRAHFASETESMRAQVAVAGARGEELVDIEMRVPRSAWDALVRFAHLLDEADEYCERGDLLTLASPPGLRRFRVWYMGQVVSQLAGAPATPWPAGWDEDGGGA